MKTLFTFILLFLMNVSFAQEFISGELIVRLKKNVNSESFFNQLSQNRSVTDHIRTHKPISNMLRLSLLRFDYESIDPQTLINTISSYSEVEAVGSNFRLQLREKTPNDIFFDQQWGLEAIDAPEVWESSTGGTTLLGDTIVVANLESCDHYHNDIQGNIWINHGEIPDDSIDNDGNGYIDDYLGYNVVSGNDNHVILDTDPHGTQTAGIIGAKGDNDIGVSGVNWNVKVMIVSNDLHFDQIIESYIYILEQRKLYNDTNGEKGAFVVATNASFGADGFPISNPLFLVWCDLYDALGEQGVLNAGATTNSKVNIDENGDMPTSCPSEYLIAVTDIDQSNELRAGYSETMIDLGAPGSTSQTISPGNGYIPFGGTSAATPHVSGGIALLYSMPCNAFAQLALDNPKEAARKMKRYIMDGAAPLPSLQGKSVTGGLLNLKNSMDEMQGDCGSPTGKLDFISIFPNPVIDEVTINYRTPDNAKYDIRIYDAIGRLVHYLSVEPVNFEAKQIKLDVSNWSPGVYNVSIENTSNIVSSRFIVQQSGIK